MMNATKGKIHKPSLVVVILAAIFTFGITVWPGISIDKLDLFKNYWWVDVVLHGTYYFLLAVIVFPLFNIKSPKVYLFFPILFALSIAFEFLQYTQPDRNVSFKDLAGNFIGISLAALFSYWGRKLSNLKRKAY